MVDARAVSDHQGSDDPRATHGRRKPPRRVSEANLILLGGGLLAAGVLASLLAGRVRLPALVVLLAVGMAAGSDGIGGLHFDDYDAARLIGVLGLAVILFEGGLATGWQELRPGIRPSPGLAGVGTPVTPAGPRPPPAVLFDPPP